MRDLWLKIGCFLTGHNFTIVKNSSEASAKSVKKYLSAILIVSILWGFIGYVFSQRYLKTGPMASAIVALVMVIVVIQIERQIILATGKVWLARTFRIIIAVVMAIIGSVIIDQIIFREDVEKLKISNIQDEVNRILPSKTAQLDLEINALDSLINIKEAERAVIIDEITKRPFIKGSTTERKNYKVQIMTPEGVIRDTIMARTDLTLTDVANPKTQYIANIDQQIAGLRAQMGEKQNANVTIRQDLETELKSKTGFLDELVLLFSILFTHNIALFVWLCLFIFFLAIELFVLMNKFGDQPTDYDMTIRHQMDTRVKMLEKLGVEK
jgi:Domain of unknown function (DUF4407)